VIGEPPDLLQQRLATFAKLMAVAFVALRVMEFVVYRMYLAIWPNHYWTIFAIGGASVALLAVVWRMLARDRALSRRALVAYDIGIATGCGIAFGGIAVLAANRQEAAYTCLVYACLVVFTRAIVVPSSGRRTALASVLAGVPVVVAAAILAVTTREDVPGPVFFAAALIYTAVGVAIAVTGSRVIYGLRRRVEALAREDLELGQYTLVKKLGGGASPP
jgi:hypothetical protein